MPKWKIYIKRIVFVSATLTIALFVFTILLSATEKTPTNGGSQVELEIAENQFHTANYKQFASYIQLGVSDEKLYLWNGRKGTLSHYINGSFREVCKNSGSWIGIFDGFFYYKVKVEGEEYTYSVNSYHMETGRITSLATVGVSYARDTFFTEDGKLYMPVDRHCTSYKVIRYSEVVEEVQQHEVYVIGENSYVLEGEQEQAFLVRYDADGKRYSYENDVPYGEKSIIPCEGGLLIHNETNGDLLYYIEAETGKAVELFAVDCIYANSSVNVHNGYAYLSFIRYSEWGPLGIGGMRDESDELNGTYRISLQDYSIEKISDEIYNGLFIFDDTGIYACNSDYQVFKLDFEGNILFELTE